MATLDDCNSVLLWLVPLNEEAANVLHSAENEHLVSTSPVGEEGIELDFPLRAKSLTTLATIGRGHGVDIYVNNRSIAKVQCSFEIERDTGIVMFYDRSHSFTSQVFGDNAAPFELGRQRKVAILENLNTVIGMGGARCELIKFGIFWNKSSNEMVNRFTRYGAIHKVRKQPFRSARTEDEAPTQLPSHYETRLRTPGSSVLKLRYFKMGLIGSGNFGSVHKAVNVDSGKLMAVKILQRPENRDQQEGWKQAVRHSLKREIEILSSISHPNIVDYIASQGWFDTDIEIFMGLKEGTLESLIHNGTDATAVADVVLPQMLRALDFIACKDIIHRDVKPENILYIRNSQGQFQFQLGDFGVSNRVPDARTRSGTGKFMAPEVASGGRQSCKADIWSLFVTMIWTLDVNGFRRYVYDSIMQLASEILRARSNAKTRIIEDMAILDANQRASAAQMLVKLFKGKGLTTPRARVPPLPNVRQSGGLNAGQSRASNTGGTGAPSSVVSRRKSIHNHTRRKTSSDLPGRTLQGDPRVCKHKTRTPKTKRNLALAPALQMFGSII